jgi:hypothetical protein
LSQVAVTARLVAGVFLAANGHALRKVAAENGRIGLVRRIRRHAIATAMLHHMGTGEWLLCAG